MIRIRIIRYKHNTHILYECVTAANTSYNIYHRDNRLLPLRYCQIVFFEYIKQCCLESNKKRWIVLQHYSVHCVPYLTHLG